MEDPVLEALEEATGVGVIAVGTVMAAAHVLDYRDRLKKEREAKELPDGPGR